MSESLKPVAVAGLEVRQTGTDVIVHDPSSEQIHVLNRAAGAVLELCDGAHDPAAIAASLAAATGAPPERVLPDVEAVLATFRELRFVR
jgi:Coenzyme PQQ synthesis protein D (PqqD)